MYKIVPAVNVLIVKNNKVLLSRRQNKSWGNGKLVLPGGHVEENETPTTSMVREIKEELGVNINKNHLEFLCTAVRYRTQEKTVAQIFTINYDYNYYNNEPYQCSELVWSSILKLPKDIIDDYKIIIKESYLNNKKYLEII